MSKTKDNRSKIAILLSVLLVSLIICLVKPSNSIMAADNGKLEIKTVHSYEEMEEAFDGDDAFYSYSGTGAVKKQYTETGYSYSATSEYKKDLKASQEYKDDYSVSVDENWELNFDEPGWLVINDYNNYQRKFLYHESYSSNYWYENAKELTASYTYLYSNKLKTKPINRVTKEGKQLSGQYYEWLDCERYYVQAGTYYLSYAGGRADSTYCLLSAVFLPAKDIVGVKKIAYNDDYTEAIVYFSALNNNWSYAGVANGKIESDKALGDKSYWSKYYKNPPIYPDFPTEQMDEFNKLLSDGWVIKENGSYSLYYKNGEGVLADYEGIVTFNIDKIGSDASDIEAKSVKLNKKKATLKKGASITLKATVKPTDTTDKTLSWTSSNSKVATVGANGKVTAKKKGTCVITATTSNGKKAKCKITVKK